jgi:two-component system sensor histidine kinase TctE
MSMQRGLPSLHRRLVSWLLIPTLAIWVSGGVISYLIAVRYADLANDRSLFDSALTLAGQVKGSQGEVMVDQSDTALKMITIDPYDIVYFKISDPVHGVIAGRQELPPPEDSERLPDKPYYHDGRVEGRRVRIASIFHYVAGVHEPVLIQVAETLVKRRVLASEILAGIILPQVLLISLATVFVWFGVGRGLSSLERVQDEVRNRSHLDLSPVREDNAPREVGALVHAINELLQQLRQVISTQNRFIADAAHQLRTPLAGIKTQTELALRQTEPELARHSLEQLRSSSDRVIHLINQLLTLARAEPGWQPDKALLDLVTVASEAASEWVPVALRKNIDLGFESRVERAPFRGNVLLLKEMLCNLIDNAIRYTQAGGEVTVRFLASERHWILAVQDNGPGVPAAERELIFERFHRAAESQDDGCGLGLAIVREIAHVHGGEVYLADSPAGALFEVHLPADSV